jgi:outer membrane murein-binding lipoprotein Lpp
MIALADVVLTLVLVAASRGAGVKPEQEKLVRDIRDLAYKELSADVDEVKAGVAQVTEDVQRIRSGFSAFKSGSGGLTGNLSPIVSLLVGAVKKSRKK